MDTVPSLLYRRKLNMGDFTWHTSDPDHTLIQQGNYSRAANLFPERSFYKPVYLLAPDGRKWREDSYEGYGRFGGVLAGAELSRWNLPAADIEGKDELELHRASITMALGPYGRRFRSGMVEFPLKFTRNPEATYDELPAAIPAAVDAQYVSLYDFDITLPDGTVLSDVDELQSFWVSHALSLGLFKGEEDDENIPYWVSDIFLDGTEKLPFPKDVSMVYTGYRQSVHQLLFDMVVLSGERYLPDPELIHEVLSKEEIERFVKIFDNGSYLGKMDMNDLAKQQMGLYETGQPLTAKPFDSTDPDLAMLLRIQRRQGEAALDDEAVRRAGHADGAHVQCRRNMGAVSRINTINPFRVALMTR